MMTDKPLDAAENPATLDGMPDPAVKRHPPSEACLDEARRRYGEEVTPADLWRYIYGAFHAPDWRERFADELETSAPRFPWVPPEDYPAFRDAGEELMDLHANFDEAPAHPGPVLEIDPPDDEGGEEREVRIGGKMKWRRVRGEDGNLGNDLTCLEIGPGVRLTSIPPGAHDYRVAGFSPVGWAVKSLVADPETGEDPNLDPRWAEEPGMLITHLRRLIYIGCRTAEISADLPPSLTLYPPPGDHSDPGGGDDVIEGGGPPDGAESEGE